MPTTRTVSAEQPGPITVTVSTLDAAVRVITGPDITTASVEISTPADDGPSADAVRDATLKVSDHRIRVDVRGGANTNVVVGGGVHFGGPGGTNVVIGTAGAVNFGTVIAGGTFIGSMINGRSIESVTGSGSSDAYAPITVTVRVPENSNIDADTASGDINTTGSVLDYVQVNTKAGDVSIGTAKSCRIKTMSGDIRVEHLTGAHDSIVSSMSGSIFLGGAAGAVVHARTMSGDIRYARNMDVTGSSMSGYVRGVDW